MRNFDDVMVDVAKLIPLELFAELNDVIDEECSEVDEAGFERGFQDGYDSLYYKVSE